MKILFLGFYCVDCECLYGDYNFLRDCGPYAFFSKYVSPMNKQKCDKLHKGEIQLAHTEYEKYRKHFNFEGGPLVGIKSLIYNLSLHNNINIKIANKIEEGYDFYYIHNINDNLINDINDNKLIINNKIIISHHIDKNNLNKLKNIKYKRWTHSNCNKSDFYLPYPIHKTLYKIYPLISINKNKNKILIFTKKNCKNLRKILLKQEKKIKLFFNNNNINCLSLSYFNKGFRRSELLNYANQSKICLYLSFYDSGGISLKEITFMGCYAIGFINSKTNQNINHSFAPSSIIENETGEFINEFSRICDNNSNADINLQNGCQKVLDIYNSNKINNFNIAKKARDYLSEDIFLETLFKS